MIATVFTPDGIAISAPGFETFYQRISPDEDDTRIERIDIEGHQRTFTFWDRYVMVIHRLDQYIYDDSIAEVIEHIGDRWPDTVPPISEVMPYVKKAIVDNNLNIIGVMAGYSRDDASGRLMPYVYQINGDDIRRINIDGNGKINYNFAIVEQSTSLGRIMRDVKVKNGETWETLPPLYLRCDLFSVDKAVELTRFLVSTAIYLDQVNSTNDRTDKVDTVIITPHRITFNQ